ncbi:hypothetical protein NIES970_25380 [[Synechococcus] sp. NIES-970]|uniref:hypothetical protein n=1 Tax=Picosynechococcus sp. NKBG15041c TaxID=1407650 RepID=UPI0003F99D9C|nr:hypothetical protein [Picosynechococcus sp. NKBG15041c]BAW97584.1 hypothetical protein NIES970_25380 [[Synechococcus] sp. NIES-970]
MMTNHVGRRFLELADGIYIETAIPRENHPALRSGFAGYPSNPRWNIRKHQAWRQGKQWRQALDEGRMVVTNQHLVPIVQPDCQTPPLEKTPMDWRSPLKKFTFSLN